MCSSHLNVTICMTQGPEEANGAVALLLPVIVTTLSSAMSPSGAVITRDVNPLPAAPVFVATVFAPKINSLTLVVVAKPLLTWHCSHWPPPSHPPPSLPGTPESVCQGRRPTG
jgi:hypothetical protein